MNLQGRKLEILKAIIDDYILSGEPVGSRTVSRHPELGLSPATIRNEMSDLEELGFLLQPHTSAGRIPSDKAYRLYVDKLMQVTAIAEDDARLAKSIYETRYGEMVSILKQVCEVVSDITNYTAIATEPMLKKVRLQHIQLVPIAHSCALVIVVTDSGVLSDTVIHIPAEMDESYLNNLSVRLNAVMKGKTIDELNGELLMGASIDLRKDRSLFEAMLDALTEKLYNAEDDRIVLGGTCKLFSLPEYSSVVRVQEFLNLMERRNLIHRMLSERNVDEHGIRVSIGSENGSEELCKYSVITATYSIGERVMGAIGVIGPTRLEYGKVISTLDYVGKSLTGYLTELYSDD